MRVKAILTAVVVASMLVAGASGTVMASHNNEVGASGSCDSGDAGGQGDVTISQSPDATGPAEVQSVAAGLQRAAQTQANCEDGDADGDGDEDYIEAHASSDGSQAPAGAVQVCFDDKAQNDPSALVNQGERCPTDAGDA